VDRRRR
jgi:hypothetical protein